MIFPITRVFIQLSVWPPNCKHKTIVDIFDISHYQNAVDVSFIAKWLNENLFMFYRLPEPHGFPECLDYLYSCSQVLLL
jgi:hypothetical protein